MTKEQLSVEAAAAAKKEIVPGEIIRTYIARCGVYDRSVPRADSPFPNPILF